MKKIKIDENEFIKICNESESMSKACAKLNLHFNTFKRIAISLGCYKPNKSGKNISKTNGREILLQDILDGKYPHYQTFKLKNKLYLSGLKNKQCECCGITSWNGKEINFELHHIDGNRFNHSLENLQILCTNCHSQTSTFKSKNKK